MRNLDTSEREAIASTIEPLIDGKEVLALCAYGSQVAGYATKESDYDVIIVLKPFSQRIKYYYLKGKTDCSALVVDPKSFENDCKKSSLGEFVSGRLLNPYFPISGEDLLKRNEVSYKKRVILEALFEAYAENSDFACEINYPLRYFLFEKLRKRAAIYRPVVYSYAQTYGEKRLETNLNSSLLGFKLAARELEVEGVIEYDEDREIVKISPQKFHGGLYARIEAMASYTTKSLTQYAVHGYAGRVKPNVVGREVLSKISRSRKSGKLPDYIVNTKRSWSLPSGKLFVQSSDWLSDLISLFGMDDGCKITQKALGEFYNSAGFYTLEDEKTKISVAIKRFKDVKGMKWGVLNLWSLKNTNFTVSAMERIFREYRASRELRRFGLSTPQILAIFLEQKISVTRFISGRDLSKLESEYLSGRSEDLSPFAKFGEGLATMHNNGYCMGDTKPSNVILSDDSKLYFVDLEQAHQDGNKAWDVAEFIYYSARFTLREEKARKLVNSFVRGYLEVAEDPQVIDNVAALRYRAPFQAFIAPNVMNALRKDLVR